ncbi:YciI family protein [Streptomyces sp. NPDC019443]|uniref:YciI family protein n=1 Tax=Streptomyces sp. NPDC019443 TaxID=3365061 RepID=UPI0037948E0A
MITAYALQSTDTATSQRGDVVTDGPFIDSKEVIAGFCIIEAPDLDAAWSWPVVTLPSSGAAVVSRCGPSAGGIQPSPDDGCDGRRTGGRRRAPARVGLRARRDGTRRTGCPSD